MKENFNENKKKNRFRKVVNVFIKEYTRVIGQFLIEANWEGLEMVKLVEGKE